MDIAAPLLLYETNGPPRGGGAQGTGLVGCPSGPLLWGIVLPDDFRDREHISYDMKPILDKRLA